MSKDGFADLKELGPRGLSWKLKLFLKLDFCHKLEIYCWFSTPFSSYPYVRKVSESCRLRDNSLGVVIISFRSIK